MTKDRALQLIKEVFDSLGEENLLDEAVIVNSDTFLLGNNSPLDSVGFITFITDLEERLIQETNNDEIYLVPDKIDGFNANNPVLSVEMLARHIVKLIGEENGSDK